VPVALRQVLLWVIGFAREQTFYEYAKLNHVVEQSLGRTICAS
jgi:hypothetical protein